MSFDNKTATQHSLGSPVVIPKKQTSRFASMKIIITSILATLLGGVLLLYLEYCYFDSKHCPLISTGKMVQINIYYGGEKKRFLHNPQIQQILQKYQITLNAHKAGSIEMATILNTHDMHCIWPSNQIAVELARISGKNVLRDENIFNSPIVFYAWHPVTEALIKAGIVKKRAEGNYEINAALFVEQIMAKRRWKETLRLNIYGAIKIFSTNPIKSNSGNIWSGMLANLLNNGNVVTTDTLPQVLGKVQTYFRYMGHMEHSSGDIFENFLKQGMGSRPIIVGYENQLPELILELPNYQQLIRQKIDILYPSPTVFASHPLIHLQPECKRLEQALLDPQVQNIAWEQHGFRTGLLGVQNEPSVLQITGIPKSIDMVMPMPSATVMNKIIHALKSPLN